MSVRFESANNEAVALGGLVNMSGGTDQLFMDCWQKKATNTSHRIISKDVSTAAGNFALAGSSGGFARFVVNGTTLTGATNNPLNVYHYLAGDYDGANMRLYVNAILDATVAKTGNVPIGGQLTRIGSAGFSPTNLNMNGDVYRIRIFERSFNQSQIQSMFEALGADTVVDGLLYEWKLTEGGDNASVGAGVIVNSGPKTLANGNGQGDGGNLPSWQDMNLAVYPPAT